MQVSFLTHSKEETQQFGILLSKFLFKKSVVTLTGDLGAGKTTLVGGVALGLNIKEKVTSPTFNIMKCYFVKPLPLYHIDAYRLESGNKDIGLEEFIDGDGATFIEWPIFIQEMIPNDRLEIEIHNNGEDERVFILKTNNEKYNPLFKELDK